MCATTVAELSGDVTPPSIKLIAFWIMGTLQICHHTQSAILWSVIILSHPHVHTHVFTKAHTQSCYDHTVATICSFQDKSVVFVITMKMGSGGQVATVITHSFTHGNKTAL